MDQLQVGPSVDLKGQPYTPVKVRSWLTLKTRLDFAEIFDCEPEQVEYHLDARERGEAWVRARIEYERGGDPFSIPDLMARRAVEGEQVEHHPERNAA